MIGIARCGYCDRWGLKRRMVKTAFGYWHRGCHEREQQEWARVDYENAEPRTVLSREEVAGLVEALRKAEPKGEGDGS